ncbi:MAG: type II toxin-antitoxin system RelE/ParE family toxin, partial [Planctomycetaceae bacterium]
MAYRIEVGDQADAEADAAYEWIATHSLQNAAKWYNGLFAAIHTLEEHPERCPLAPDNEAFDQEVRQL